jgi:hypothetical protein
MLTKNTTYDDDRVPGESDEQRYQRFYAMMDERSRDGTPYFWTGLHSSLVGATDDVVLPPIGQQHDWELELAVVIGRSGRLVTPEEAQDMIAGYTVLNDLGSIDVSAMAIEDAVVLGEEVAAGGTVQETLQRFMTRRFERVLLVVETSVELGRMMEVASRITGERVAEVDHAAEGAVPVRTLAARITPTPQLRCEQERSRIAPPARPYRRARTRRRRPVHPR